ncbi:MAG: hypothetical protein LBK40_04895 [Spirochaetaceae bacterium]|jgi:hypothetical protein|nr:hypothetical protein [Spirochaetaceae bacterium]
MKKVLAVLLVFSAYSLSAQEAPRAVLSDTWVENFISNWDAVNNAMSELNEEEGDMAAALTRFVTALAACLEDTPPNFAEYRASFLALRNTRLPPEGEKIFTRYGVETDAFWVCMMGFLLLSLEKKYYDLQEILAERGTELRQIIHPGDFTVLEKNFDRLYVIFGDM